MTPSEMLGIGAEGLPVATSAAHFYTGTSEAWFAELFSSALLAPAADMAARPSKKIRARLVDLGATAVVGRERSPALQMQIERAGQAMELLHAGSLMIDDIQDQSPSRRGDVAAHQKFGTSATITAGNWLYFWPLRLLDGVIPHGAIREALRNQYLLALEKAHLGQALDLNTRMDQLAEDRWEAVVEATLLLKTASITELAMSWGATIAAASTGEDWEPQSAGVGKIGLLFGVLLQRLDDLGNLFPAQNADKTYEDVTNRKPSWIWVLAKRLGLGAELLAKAQNPSELDVWSGRHLIREEGLRLGVQDWQAVEDACLSLGDRADLLSPSLRELKEKLYADYFAG